jgi:putative transposase
MRKTPLENGEYYHIFNRGVNKSVIIQNDADFRRFYESLYLFNDSKYRRIDGRRIDEMVQMSSWKDIGDDRDHLVKINAYCLLDNHFHLFLRQIKENGISTFMQQIGKGYAQYYNKKYNRTGPLFEGRFKSVHVKNEGQFYHLSRYIHLNALDGVSPEWREGRVVDWDKAITALESYQWSSYGVYVSGTEELPVVDISFIDDNFGEYKYQDFMKEWSERELAILPLIGTTVRCPDQRQG